ncbi:Rod shape-determining protein MreC [hydrothermal vent metagenome]|uniref:Rod shape-determining protein MreC n=1 Tax=hydrothermal vent metagenome TaxID=652676 RepID=A0A1W1CZ22_9ZZZZ
MITVLLSRNDAPITDMLLGTINPIKQKYQSFTQEIEDKSQSYIFQKESIERLSHENRILRKRLLEQMHYIEKVKDVYDILPHLSKIPQASISIIETISYVKLNSFSQVILTKPKRLVKDKLYGLIQKNVVAGIARVISNQLYGYLTSDSKCRFSVFIGESDAPGIAIGSNQNKMMVKFIPKWHNVQVGDKVITSGLDDIFFVNIPVGIVTKVEVQSSYTVAHIKTYSDIFHPKTFFLIHNASPTLTEGFDKNQIYLSNPKALVSIVDFQDKERKSAIIPLVSSIPKRVDQTEEKEKPDNIEKKKTLTEH